MFQSICMLTTCTIRVSRSLGGGGGGSTRRLHGDDNMDECKQLQ